MVWCGCRERKEMHRGVVHQLVVSIQSAVAERAEGETI